MGMGMKASLANLSVNVEVAEAMVLTVGGVAHSVALTNLAAVSILAIVVVEADGYVGEIQAVRAEAKLLVRQIHRPVTVTIGKTPLFVRAVRLAARPALQRALILLQALGFAPRRASDLRQRANADSQRQDATAHPSGAHISSFNTSRDRQGVFSWSERFSFLLCC